MGWLTLDCFSRRLKILEHFHYDTGHVPELFFDPSGLEPGLQDVTNHLRALIEGDRESLETFQSISEGKNNITSAQRKALTELSRNGEVIIEAADKGGQIVLQDKACYL